ncbi:Zinc finger C3H1 domain-containing protein [Mortierella sp. AD031]|nr:Zinc finger C3H1 domain-containing protein [Mortierella sp. AD031]
MDLEALRAAVLNSRKPPTATSASADPSAIAAATTPVQGASPASVTVTTPPTTSTAVDSASSASAQTTGGLIQPPMESDSNNMTESDKEEGEISDEDIETIEGTVPRPATDTSSAKSQNNTTFASSSIPAKSLNNTAFASSSFQQYSAKQDYRPQQPSGDGSRNPANATENGRQDSITTEQGGDFTSLMAAYQLSKAKTDSSSQLKANPHDSAAVSDIPGLGQFRNRERSLPPLEDAFRSRDRPSDNHYGSGSGYSRDYQQSSSYSRDAYPRSRDRDFVHRGPERPIQLPRRQLSSPASFPTEPKPPNPYVSSEKSHTTPQPSGPNAVDTPDIYRLVDELLGHGVTPEQLLQRSIDPAVVNHVYQQRALRLGTVSSMATTPSFLSNPVTPSSVSVSVSTNPQSQSNFPQQPWSAPPFPQPTAFGPPVSPATDSGTVSAIEVAARLQQFLQNQSTPSQPYPPAVTSPTIDDSAQKKLELILSIASRVLPQGWDSLVQPHQVDNSTAAPSALGPSTAPHSQQDSLYNNSDVPLVIPLRRKVEEQPKRRASGSSVPSGSTAKSGARAWSQLTEERDTTKKFGDLTISSVAIPSSPSQPVSTLTTRVQAPTASNRTQSMTAQTHPSEKSAPPPPPPPPSAPLPPPPPPPPPPGSPPKVERSPSRRFSGQAIPGASGGSESVSTNRRIKSAQGSMSSTPPGREAPSSGPQDEMDMDLDDGYGASMILNGSWKTTEERTVNGSNFPAQQPPNRPIYPYNQQFGNATRPNTHSAPASIANTPVRSPVQAELPQGATLSRTNSRRATAMDFIPKVAQPTPFIVQRQLPCLIDLDDENGDEMGGEPATENSSMPKSRMAPTSELTALQQRMKDLNERIAARQRAMLSSPSTPVPQNSSPQSPAQGVSSPMSQQPDPTSRKPSPQQNNQEMTSETSSTQPMDEADQLEEALIVHTKTLEQLRSQLQQSENEKLNLSNSMGAEGAESEKYRQSLQEVYQTLKAAKEIITIKTRELEEAQRHFSQTETLLGPLVKSLDASTAAKKQLQDRLNQADASCAELKSSISKVQQDIMRKRMRMMQLGSAAAKPVVKIPDPNIPSRPEKPVQQRPGAETAQNVVANRELPLSEDTGTKRGIEPNGSTWDPTVPKKPRIHVKEELSALTKRMNELVKEKELLSTAALSSAPVHAQARPTAASMNDQSPIPVSSQSNVKRAPPLQSVPIPAPKSSPAVTKNLTKPKASRKKPVKDLSKLDQFLNQPKDLPEEAPSKNRIRNALPSAWSPSAEINKLFTLDNFLFDISRLCLPSDLAIYPIPQLPKESEANSSVPQKSHSVQDQPLDVTSDYQSPLSMFRSFRFSPRFKETVPGGYRSLTYSHKIDPMKRMCLYELSGGSCNDDNCKSQHIRNCGLTDEELVVDFARYTEGKSAEARKVFAHVKSAKLAHLRAAGIHNTNILIDSIFKAHDEMNKNQLTPSVIKFGPRVILKTEEEAPPSTAEKPLMHTGPSVGIDNLPGTVEPKGNPFDQHPITLAILTKTLAGTPPSKHVRYHDKSESTDYETLLEDDPSDAIIWAEFAMHELSASTGDPDEFDEQVRKSLGVLSRALSSLPTSETLWGLYLDLHSRYGTELETRTMFEQCLQYVPQSRLLWFRYYLWEKGSDERIFVLDRMLQVACQDPAEGADPVIRSRFIVDVVLQIVKNMVKDGIVEAAKNWTQNFLTCTTWESVRPSSLSYAQLDDVWLEQDMVEDISSTLASRLLTPKDLCILWLAYVYLIWFHELPSALFYQYPNDYLSDDSFFVIQWPVTEETEQESDLHSIVHEIFLGLTVYFVDCDAQLPVIALLRNFVGFLMSRGQNEEEIMELVNPCQLPQRLALVRDLFCEVQLFYGKYDEAKEVLDATVQEMPHEPYFWNRYAYMLPVDEKADCLAGCARSFFAIDDAYDEANAGLDSSELAILLYKKLLGLDLPYTFNAPPTRVNAAPLRTNTFLWLNYLSLLALQAQDIHTFDAMALTLSAAVDTIPMRRRSLVVAEHAIHSIMLGLDKAFEAGKLEGIIESATSDIVVSKPNPYDKRSGEDLGVSSLHDFGLLNKIVETVWKRITKGPDELRVHLMGSLLRLYPNDFDLYLWLGEAQEGAGHIEQCRKILVSCLRRFPTSEHLWKRMIEIFKDSESDESSDLIRQASVFSPLAYKLNRMPALGQVGDRIAITTSEGNGSGAMVIDIADDDEEEMPLAK